MQIHCPCLNGLLCQCSHSCLDHTIPSPRLPALFCSTECTSMPSSCCQLCLVVFAKTVILAQSCHLSTCMPGLVCSVLRPSHCWLGDPGTASEMQFQFAVQAKPKMSHYQTLRSNAGTRLQGPPTSTRTHHILL